MFRALFAILFLGLLQIGCGEAAPQQAEDAVDVSQASSPLYTTCSLDSYAPCQGRPVGALCGNGLGRTYGPWCQLTSVPLLTDICECRITSGGSSGGGSGGSGGGSGGSGGGGGGGPIP